MAIEKVDRLPPHVALRAEIAKHRRSMMVAASGMGPVLEILDAYVAATEDQLCMLGVEIQSLRGQISAVAAQAGVAP